MGKSLTLQKFDSGSWESEHFKSVHEYREAVVHRCSSKIGALKSLANRPQLYYKDTPTLEFYVKFAKFLRTPQYLFERTPSVAASGYISLNVLLDKFGHVFMSIHKCASPFLYVDFIFHCTKNKVFH